MFFINRFHLIFIQMFQETFFITGCIKLVLVIQVTLSNPLFSCNIFFFDFIYQFVGSVTRIPRDCVTTMSTTTTTRKSSFHPSLFLLNRRQNCWHNSQHSLAQRLLHFNPLSRLHRPVIFQGLKGPRGQPLVIIVTIAWVM